MTIVIAAGGTGGHLYPAVALAREFLRYDPRAKILFVGTARGLESKVLAHEGFELVLISAKPVMGKGLFGALTGLCATGQFVAVSENSACQTGGFGDRGRRIYESDDVACGSVGRSGACDS